MASLSRSGSTTTAMARKNGVTAVVCFYYPARAQYGGLFERDTKAIHAEGQVLIGVRIDGNDEAAATLLTSLIGHASAAAAPYRRAVGPDTGGASCCPRPARGGTGSWTTCSTRGVD